MDVERLISKLFNATYTWKGTTGSYRDTAIHDDEAARGAIKGAVYEWAAEEITEIDKGKRIAELEAKCYTYEKVIANSNFAPVAETSLGYCQKIYNLDTPEEVVNKIMRVKAGSVAEIISELQAREGGDGMTAQDIVIIILFFVFGFGAVAKAAEIFGKEGEGDERKEDDR
jgi:hypothetical protein